MKLSLPLSVCMVFSLIGCAEKTNDSDVHQTVSELPNIVILYADDMGHGDLAVQNPQSKIPTPNLDKLAAEGLRFTDAHSSSGICSPSRYALLTGNYHWRRQHQIVKSFESSMFKADELTLAKMLKQKGYYTAAIGKWHLGWDWPALMTPEAKKEQAETRKKHFAVDDFDWSKSIPGGPLDQGFDYYFGDGTINFPPYAWIENDRFLQAPSEPVNRRITGLEEGNSEFRPGPAQKDWDPYDVLPTITKKAVNLVNQQTKDKPFFLYFAFPSPHAPIIPNEEFKNKTQAGPYGDFVFQTDWVAGQILQALKAQGLDENTLVIFSSDNGPEVYAFERMKNYEHASMGELRGLKRDIWEGGHRVPFIAKWPGHIPAGEVSTEVISQVDIMQTIAKVVDYSLPNDTAVDSYNLLPLFKGEKIASPIREAIVHNTWENQYAIRQDNWVLVNHNKAQGRIPDWYYDENGYDRPSTESTTQLYNLENDLAQKHNLEEQFPEKVQALQTLLTRYRETGRSVER